MEGIQISVERHEPNPDISLVRINGYIDTTTSSELERVIQNLLREQRYKIIVDLTGVDYISSAGWGIFISEIKNLRAHRGDLKLAHMSDNVNEVYELLEFSTILNSAKDVDEAVRLFEKGQSPESSAIPNATSVRPKPAAADQAPAARPAVAAKPAATPSPARPAVPAPAAIPVPPAAPSLPPAAPPSAPVQPAEAATGAMVPLISRIRNVVRAYPEWGPWKVKKELNRTRGSQPKISWGEVRAEMKLGGLGSKKERRKFSQS